MACKPSFESKAKEKALTRATFYHKNKLLSNNFVVFFQSQMAKFQKNLNHHPVTTLKFTKGNGKTILVKEMLLSMDSKEESTVNTSHAESRALVDRQYLDSILNDVTVCNDCHSSQDF